MAIKFLHDLDLTGQELQNVKLHVTSSAPTAAAGAIYFDSGANVVKVHDGTSFKTLSTDTDDALNQYSTSVVSSSGVKLRLSGSGTSGNTTDDVEFAGSGTVSVARTNDSKITITGSAPSAGSASSLGTIKLFSDTTQTVAAESVSATNGRTYGLQVDSNGRGVVNIPWTDTDTNTQRAAGTGLSLSGNTLNANVDGTNSVAANSSSSTANRTYKIQVDSSDNLVVNVPWANTDTNTDTLQTISDSNSSSEQFVTFVANATYFIAYKITRTGNNDASPRGDSDGNRLRCFGSIARSTSGDADPIFLQWVDSPGTTSSMTYQLQNYLQVGGSSYAFYNREGNDANSSFVPRCASTILLMEIAA